ncbi:MAG: hypothetical protein ACKVPX_15750 [Myxococcaceae bacterium]
METVRDLRPWLAEKLSGRDPGPPTTLEAFQRVHEARGRAPAAVTQTVLDAYLRYLSLEWLRESTHVQTEAIEARDRAPWLLSQDATCAAQAWGALRWKTDGAERERLLSALRTHNKTLEGLFIDRAHTAQKAAAELGHENAARLWGETPEQEKVSAGARQLLARTEDAYQDLSGYFSKRVSSVRSFQTLKHIGASALPPGASALSGVVRAVDDWSAQMGLLSPRLLRRENFSASDAPWASHAVDFGAPHQVLWRRVLGDGIDCAVELLASCADAQRLLSADPDDAPEAGRLIHPDVGEAYRQLFADLLCEEAWISRFLEVSRQSARELARLGQFARLLLARSHAARTLHFLANREGAMSTVGFEALAEQLSLAWQTEFPKELAPREWDAGGASATWLKGAMLAGALTQKLREAFGEDFFRNPAAGAWLTSRFRQGARVSGETLDERRATTLESTVTAWLERLER